MASFGLQDHLNLLRDNLSHTDFSIGKIGNQDELRAWQLALRVKLCSIMGLDGRIIPPVSAQQVDTLDCGDYIEEKYSLDAGEGVQIPVYVLVPNRQPPFSTVLVFHGHEPSVQYCLGHYPDEETERHHLSIGNNYAQALARAGYLVAAVEQRGFGERVTTDLRGPFPRSCRHLSLHYSLYGRTLLGERCWDGQRVLDFLLTRPDVKPGQIAITGHSGGGATALWLAAIEPRLSGAAVSGYFSSFRASIGSEAHCECNYVPGILSLAEMSDLAALIAPRPFCALNGEKDRLFPIEAARTSMETVQRAYQMLGATENCHLAVHPGGHEYPQALSLVWLKSWLA
jgi:dienelactone hydrolase